MDIVSLVSAIMQALAPMAPFLDGVSAGMATKLGENISDAGKEQVTRLYSAIRQRFAKENDGGRASQALQAFVDDPGNAGTVRIKLERILQNDPAFASELLAIMRSGPYQSLIVGEEATAPDIDMSNASGAGTQQIHTGKKSTTERVRMNIPNPDNP